MKNRKGFTLVELLAVIAILAILVIIALPNVMSMFNNAKRSSFETEVKQVFKLSKSEWMSDSLNSSGEKIYSKCDSGCNNPLNNMDVRNDLSYYVRLDGTGKVTDLYVTDGTHQYEYKGDDLKIENITDIKIVANISEEEKINASCFGSSPNANCKINNKESLAIEGYVISQKMKALANPDVSVNYSFSDSKITSIIRSDNEPSDENKKEKNIISTNDSSYPAYIWYDNGIIYWWTESGTLTLNENSNYMFYNFTKLVDISSFQYFDTSNVKKLYAFLNNDGKIRSLEPLRNWDTSKLENISFILSYAKSVESLDPLKGWNVSNVKYMTGSFNWMYGLKEIDLDGWDTSNVVSMNSMFNDCINVTYVNVKSFDTSNVTDFGWMFNELKKLKELDISNFDTRKGKSFKRMFNNSTALEHIYVGDNWDTSLNIEEATAVFPTSCKLPNYSTSNDNYRHIKWANYDKGGYLTYKENN